MNQSYKLQLIAKSFFYDQKLFQDGLEKSAAEQDIFPYQYFRVGSRDDM
jgi:hypothetical protein